MRKRRRRGRLRVPDSFEGLDEERHLLIREVSEDVHLSYDGSLVVEIQSFVDVFSTQRGGQH